MQLTANKKPVTRNITGFPVRFITGIYNLYFFWKAIREYRSFRSARAVMSQLFKLQAVIAGRPKIFKMVRSAGLFYWNMHLPGFPSRKLTEHVLGEMNRIISVRSRSNSLCILFIGITKKCPLRCEHCYEWKALNQREVLSLDELKGIIRTFQRDGVSHIQMGGGEPMARFNELLELIREASLGSEVWISTCGYGLDAIKAARLKSAGLRGVAISIDHFDPGRHNAFRGSPKAYDWAIEATENCQKAGLITCWSLCVTRDFISRENLLRYASEAMIHHVPYIQLFEAMPSGRYEGKDVALSNEQFKVLEDFYFDLNTNPAYRKFPLAVYLGSYQRIIGCLGSGNRYLYVDTDGNLQHCPFCRTEDKMPVNGHSAEELLQWIIKKGCPRMNDHARAMS